MDSSEEWVGSQDIEVNNIGGKVGIDGVEGCRTRGFVSSEDYRVGGAGSIESLRESHMCMSQRTFVDRRHMLESLV